MKKIGLKFSAAMSIGVVATIVLYLLFIKSPYFAIFQSWSSSNMILFFVFLTLIKILGVIWPPIPGGLFTLGAIPILGWLTAYTADFLGSVTGSIIAYVLGNKYGFPFLEKILDGSTIQKIKKIKIKKNKEFESMFFLRIFGGSIMEVVVYASGLLGVRFSNFIVAGTLSHLLVGLPTYFLAGELASGKNAFLHVASFVLLIVIFSKFKNRYFEW